MRFSITIQGKLVFHTARRSIANIRARREAAQIAWFWRISPSDTVNDVRARARSRGVMYSAAMLALVEDAVCHQMADS